MRCREKEKEIVKDGERWKLTEIGVEIESERERERERG